MDENSIKTLLEGVAKGEIPVDEAILKLKKAPFDDLDFAKVDLHRRLRQGQCEVIYGEGKTPEQIIKIAEPDTKRGKRIIITRLSRKKQRK